jgi:DNA polymerase-2
MCIRVIDAERAEAALKARGLELRLEETPLRSFDGFACLRLRAEGSLLRACDALSRAGIEVFGREEKGAVAFLVRNGIRAGVRVSGGWRAGSGVDVVFPDAEIVPAHGARAPLSVLSLDIETEEPAGKIRAVGLSLATFGPDGKPLPDRRRALLFTGAWGATIPRDPEITVLPDETSLLRALVREMRDMDPDIVTGWNVIDFDFPRLAAAFARARVSFALGRSVEAGIFFPSERDEAEGGEGGEAVGPRRSASVFLPGRQVLDALRLVRTGFHSFESYTLDAVAHEILGRGKTVTVEGRQKLAELDRLYAEDPLSFCRYCLNDADLVLDILERKDLVHHTVERAALTGAGIDKAWTSVASFERMYAAGLYARGVLEPNMPVGRNVSGAAGGTVLEPAAGIFSRVAVFDFRSLYPSVIRTFNVDPLSYERALSLAGSPDRAGELITAPNGARFVREPGILPLMIAEYFEERLKAIARGDDASAYVYKILMNSYYGVLGAKNCRYARTELAGAITSFGKLCLHFARDFFAGRGFRVLYGDTDSVFVELGAVGTDRLEGLAGELNDALARHIREEYALESFIAIRSEKLYERFFIPRLRSPGVHRAVETGGGLEHDEGEDSGGEDARGRAKGYAGLLVKTDGSTEVDIKGMEAARSDYSPLTRRFQRDLLGHLFRDADTATAEAYLRDEIVALFRGERDGELAFKKKLRRDPDSYVASTPPHVKVARDLGITRRGATVEYVITVNGPEATALRRSAIDYGWYAVSQVLPVARSAGTAAGFDADAIVASLHADGQLEFSW